MAHSEHESVALGIEHAMRVGHIVVWPGRLYNIFPRYLIRHEILRKKKVGEYKMFGLLYLQL
jgi:hypothetical protein